MADAADLVPVTVLGGYLGAGKTTILNRLLAGDHGRRLAVLVNDFGAVDIDTDLITAHDGDTISLENGCICCSIADALGDALDRVLAIEPRPDHIVIEASGVAEPDKVAHYGRGWPGCRLDAVVVAVDAETIRRRARDRFVGDLVVRQLAGADVLLLTKTDLVDAGALADVTEWLGRTATGDPTIVPVVDGRVPPSVLLEPAIDPRPDVGDDRTETAPGTGGDAGARFVSRTIPLDGPVDRERLERALAGWPTGVVRVKGLVTVAGEGRHVAQRVGRRWSIEPIESFPADGNDRLVVIGIRGMVDLETLATDLLSPS